MVTYEITATARLDVAEAWDRYMRERHIPELLETGAFLGATLSRSEPGRYRIRYEARSREALDRYLAEHAARLRKHHQEMFPSGVEVSREEWEVLATWPRSP